MYLYYILGWRLTTGYFKKLDKGEPREELEKSLKVKNVGAHTHTHTHTRTTMAGYMCDMSVSVLGLLLETTGKHLSLGSGRRHRLPARCSDAAGGQAEALLTCRRRLWQDSPHWHRYAQPRHPLLHCRHRTPTSLQTRLT